MRNISLEILKSECLLPCVQHPQKVRLRTAAETIHKNEKLYLNISVPRLRLGLPQKLTEHPRSGEWHLWGLLDVACGRRIARDHLQ